MKKVIDVLDTILKLGIIATTVIMVVSSTLQVLSRLVLPHPFSWTEELARYSFIWWVFLGAAYALRLNGHLGMDIFVKLLSPKGKVIFQKIVFLLTFGFMLLVTVLGVRIVLIQSAQRATLLPISMGWVYGVVPFTGLIMLVYCTYLLFYWPEIGEGENEPEAGGRGSIW